MPEDFSELEARLTETARASLERAGLVAHSSGSPYVGTEHVLLGVLAQNSSLGAKVLAENGVTLDRAEMALDLTAQALVIVVMHKGVNAEVLEMMRTAWQLAMEFGQRRIGTEHIVYSILLQREARATKLLGDMNVDIEALRGSLEELFDRQQSEADEAVSSETGRRASSTELKMLERFGIDLTERARAGMLDPVIGRDKETERMITVLGRRSKNNPALIGEPGVGKTAVVEGLAQRIAEGRVPAFLVGKRVVQLDLTAMVAGTKFRGQFEERLQKVLAAVRKHQEIILFIDELHLLVGAGSAEGSMDAANVLKPALARGEVRVIGATTFDEYRKHIEKDAALGRRFQAVTVSEPTAEQAVAMLEGLRQRLATHHRVRIPEELLRLSVELSQRFVMDRQLPDKAIDVLDEAAALVNATRPAGESKRDKLARSIKQLAGKIDAAVEAEEYQRAAELKTQMKRLEQRAAELTDDDALAPVLTEGDVRRAVAAMTGVPVERLAASEARALAGLERRLNAAVLGQREAVEQLARAIRRSRSGLGRTTGPMGSFVFLGPTGVGKTELARVLAREVFGGDNHLIKIDMSEFAEKHTASRLVGAPAGYVGYDDGGKLTDRVHRQPYSVVLFDEIEKAHPDVLNLLLQLLEDGQLTDAQGRSVSFRQTIVILTSNVGAEAMMRTDDLGFGVSQRPEMQDERNERQARQALEALLRPELVGRFDAVLTFKALTRQVAGKIVDALAQDLHQAVRAQGMTLELRPSMKRLVLDEGFDQQRGARVLRRTLQALVADPLSDVLIAGRAKPGAVLTARAEKGRVAIDVANP
ncbi:MAG: ATP-dependent Clp protease ATP-binding subunit [Candidatus Saccharibacteria bacterium]|nr:ATP-dependent Clp protease ATP-binding subunit [Candidatus Saccharibacteria bacterium]